MSAGFWVFLGFMVLVVVIITLQNLRNFKTVIRKGKTVDYTKKGELPKEDDEG